MSREPQAPSPFVRLTPLRASILRLAETETVISASDVALNVVRGRNKRTAIRQLKALADLGFLTPVRTCEYMLSKGGQLWLDNHRAIHDPL